jgi:hypothetical protein
MPKTSHQRIHSGPAAGLRCIATDAHVIAKSSHEFIQKTEPSHDEAHRTTVDALRKLNESLRLVAATVQIRVGAPSKEIDGETGEKGDDEPTGP